MSPEYETVSDILYGPDKDGGRITSRPLADWLGKHRDNDVKVTVHNIQVPIGAAHYCDLADSIVLHLVDGNDLRQATAFCLAGSPKLIDAIEELTRRWRHQAPKERSGQTPSVETLLLWLAGAA